MLARAQRVQGTYFLLTLLSTLAALTFSGFEGKLEAGFARGQMVSGAAMLAGSVAGGFVAQVTDLGVPYIFRSILLGLTLVVAFFLMKDVGFTPTRGKGPLDEIRNVARASLDEGWRNPPLRWLMLSAPFTTGVGMYAFYALQPYLLELYGDKTAFGMAGLAAATIAGTQILGGLTAPLLRGRFRRRTDVLLIGSATSIGCLAVIGRTSSFWIAIAALVVWGMAFSIVTGRRRFRLPAFLSRQRPHPGGGFALLGARPPRKRAVGPQRGETAEQPRMTRERSRGACVARMNSTPMLTLERPLARVPC